MRVLFVENHLPLTVAQLRTLYTVEFAEEGSNRRVAEEDTVYSFEVFLQFCEGKIKW